MEVVWRILSCCCSVGETEALAEEEPLGEWMQRPAEPGVCRGAVSTPERSPLPKPGSWGAEVVTGEGAPETRTAAEKEVSDAGLASVAVGDRLFPWLGRRRAGRGLGSPCSGGGAGGARGAGEGTR